LDEVGFDLVAKSQVCGIFAASGARINSSGDHGRGFARLSASFL
jgi:hypothetical protein